MPTSRISLRVQPGAARNRVVGRVGDEWKIAVQAPAIDGRANKAAIEFLAEIAGARRGEVELVRGASSRQKVFDVKGVSAAALDERFQEATTKRER